MANHDAVSTTPRWFRPVAIVALIWNLLGCFAYLSDVTMKPEDIAKLTQAEPALVASRPAWSIGATAVAVWFGAAGCVGLILRKRWATWLLIASFIGVLLQDLWFLSHAFSMTSAVALVLQGVVLVVSIALVYLARAGSARGWLR